jgi:tRNA (adenine-N(1)-)-methyltransferase non-catalytic subunit
MSAQTNTLTILHSNNQPNLAHLKFFSYDAGNPDPNHPLYTHLKSLSWLQLLHPHDDPSYAEPEVIPDEVLATMKSSKRGTYYKKRRRWERTSRVVDETRRGGFDGLVIASSMEPKTIMRALVPLVRGGGRVVVYSANVEPLAELCDYYSKDRRAAFVARQEEKARNGERNGVKEENGNGNGALTEQEEDEDFPVNPTLLLAPSLQTSRARHYQVLPGRTHPMMTSKGGAEGYIFTATRVIPAEGKVEARGHFRGKKRKTGTDTAVAA